MSARLDRTCHTPFKHQYSTKAVALMVANRSKRVKLYVYRCPGCRAWHLTKKPRAA